VKVLLEKTGRYLVVEENDAKTTLPRLIRALGIFDQI